MTVYAFETDANRKINFKHSDASPPCFVFFSPRRRACCHRRGRKATSLTHRRRSRQKASSFDAGPSHNNINMLCVNKPGTRGTATGDYDRFCLEATHSRLVPFFDRVSHAPPDFCPCRRTGRPIHPAFRGSGSLEDASTLRLPGS